MFFHVLKHFSPLSFIRFFYLSFEQKDEIDVKQASFQSQLLEDLDLDKDESLISSNEESKDLSNESSIEEEQINEPSIK